MKITVFGTGYVGLVAATCFAEMGHQVLGIDIDEAKVKKLQKGEVPFYEMGLQDLLTKNIGAGRLEFSLDAAKGIEFGEIIISAVSAFLQEDHTIYMGAVRQVAETFGKYISDYKVFVNKSTVPVGTGQECEKIIQSEMDKREVSIPFDVVSNPEFLREGAAIKDFLNPERVVVGATSNKAKEMMEKLYRPLIRSGRPLVFTNVKSAEIIKYAANSFLATKISFINEIANFCEYVGGDIGEVSKALGMDSRIGHRFLHAGIGYGGSCLPKDIKALIKKGEYLGFDFKLLRGVDLANEHQKIIPIKKLIKHLPDLSGKTIAIWGLSFKPKTDDGRDAPAFKVINELLKRNAIIKAYDPMAIPYFQKRLTYPNLHYHKTAFEAARGANALLVLTEWDEFRAVDLGELKKMMKGDVLIDGRNIYEPKEAVANGFCYEGVGRGSSAVLPKTRVVIRQAKKSEPIKKSVS